MASLYKTFNDIIEHKYKVFDKKSSKGFILQIEVGDRNGTPLFTLKGLNNYTHNKELYFGNKAEFICCLPNHDNFLVKCGMHSKNVEGLIAHQRTSHNVKYSSEFFQQDETTSYNPLDILVHENIRQKNQHNELQSQEFLEISKKLNVYGWDSYLNSDIGSMTTFEYLSYLKSVPNNFFHRYLKTVNKHYK